MSSARKISREIGTAFAVLAIYLLTVLAPLHHARASQLGFEQLGYTTIDTGWVLCNSADDTDGDRDISVAKCPATGVAKSDAVLPTLDAVPVVFSVAAYTFPLVDAPQTPSPAASPNGPRAPPALV